MVEVINHTRDGGEARLRKWRDGGLEAGKELTSWDARVRNGRIRGYGH